MTETRINSRRSVMERKRRRARKIVLLPVSLLLLLALTVVAVSLYNAFHSLQRAAEQMYQPLPNTAASRPLRESLPETNTASNIAEVRPITILFLGIDQWEGEKGRTDTLLLAAVHPGKKRTLLLSIPRDTQAELAGSGRWDKINHAYAYGGTEMTLHTVHSFLGIPLDYYVSVNMDGFEQIIDALGGVEVHNQTAYQYWGYQFPEGIIQLDGERALAYARMRYFDPAGDLGRNRRQQQVIKGLLDKLKKPTLITNYDHLLSQIGEHVKTNIRFAEWQELIISYRPAAEHVESEQLDGWGEIIDGVYYYIVTPEERTRVRERFLAFLAEEEVVVLRPLGGAIP